MPEPFSERPHQHTLNIDEFLNGHSQCRLGKGFDSDGKKGFFSEESKMFASLGGKNHHPGMRTLLFGANGQITVVETMSSLSVGHPTVIGRNTTGGEYVSASHASIGWANGSYTLEDCDSTNGTVLYKAKVITSGTNTFHEKAVAVEKQAGNAVIMAALSKDTMICIVCIGEGEYSISDASPGMTTRVQKLRLLAENDSLLVGSPSNQASHSSSGERMFMSDARLATNHVRIFVKEGNLFIMNLTDVPIKVTANGIVSEVREKVQEVPSRTSTDQLMKTVNEHIALLRAQGKPHRTIYRELALKYHPDYNKQNPDANRLMQLLNVAFGKVGKYSSGN